jgi:hypothetical protein
MIALLKSGEMVVDLGGRQFGTGSLKTLPDETNLQS